MGKLNDKMLDFIPPAVRPAAEKAAEQYDIDRQSVASGNTPFDTESNAYWYATGGYTDIEFDSTTPSAYTGLISAISRYAETPNEKKETPTTKYLPNVKSTGVFEKNKEFISFDQYASIIHNALKQGCTKWKYVPYGLVYPKKKQGVAGVSDEAIKAAQQVTGTLEMWNKSRPIRNTANYESEAAKELVQQNIEDGSTAATSLNKVLTKRKAITTDFGADISGDEHLNNFCRMLMPKLEQNYNYRKDFFSVAQQNKSSELYRWLIDAGYTEELIRMLSGYKD